MKKEIKANVLGANQQEEIQKLLSSDNYKYPLAGFAEGEGTLLVSIVKNDNVIHKYRIQPEFNVAQHESGMNILYSYKSLFDNLGSVHKKSGSDKVWVFSIKGIDNILSYVIPSFEKYVLPYSSKYNDTHFNDYRFILNRLQENKNKTMDKQDFIELITLAYNLNPEGKGKQIKRTLDDLIKEINAI